MRKYRKFLDKKQTEFDYIKSELDTLTEKEQKIRKRMVTKEKALIFIKQVAIKTQNQLSGKITDMVATGLNSVFIQKYGFLADFDIKRDQPQCLMMFEKNKRLIDPLEFSGLGAADVAGFCLRTSCLSIASSIKNIRKILIIDEPFQRLKGIEENRRVIKLMKSLSDKLNMQIICVNDERAPREDIIKGADKVFYIEQKNNIAKVKELS